VIGNSRQLDDAQADRHAQAKRLRRGFSVSIVGSLPPVKGVSAYTLSLLEALDEHGQLEVNFVGFRGIYPHWAYPGGSPIEPNGKSPLLLGVRHRRPMSWYNPFSWAWAGLRMRGRLVHVQWWSYALAPIYMTTLGLARLRRKRIVMTVHNVEPHETGMLKRFLNRQVFRFAHHFIVHSEANKTTLQRLLRCDPGRISVLPHGVLDTPRTGMNRAQARRKLGIAGEAHVILCFGNIRPYKGVDVLLRAFANVCLNEPQALLVIAGQPWGDWAPYQTLIDELGIGARVHRRLEYIPSDEIEPYFVAADVVALPYTHFDAQSGVGTRALPFGRPLVVTNTGGLPELVLDEEAVVPAGDAEALARSLLRIIGDAAIRDRMSVESLALAASLGWEAIAERTVEIYAAVLGDEGTPADAHVEDAEAGVGRR
jgi:glycosyltransferase involved in cell wall biosynthesis